MVKELKPLIVFGKHPFIAEEDDEIEFQIGDPVLVLEKDEDFNDGWWKGRTMSGEVGLFPVNFTTTENLFNVNVNGFFETNERYVPNIIDDENGLSPFGTFNSLSYNNSDEGIRRSLSKSADSTNSSGVFENRPSSPNGSVSSMRALSSPRISTSLPNNSKLASGEIENKSSFKNMNNQMYSQSQPSSIPQYLSQSQHLSQSQSQSQLQLQLQSQTQSQSQQSQNSGSRVNSSAQVRGPQDWTVEEVCNWLSSINGEKIIPAIKENGITGDKLLELNLSKLREYGIHSLSERIELLHEILTLREEYLENSKNLFNGLPSSNASSFVSDYESYSTNEQNKLHKASSNFSISEYYDKSENEYEDDQAVQKSSSSNEGSAHYTPNQEKYHHELPVTPQNYKPGISGPSKINNYGGMSGVPNINGVNNNINGNMNNNNNINGHSEMSMSSNSISNISINPNGNLNGNRNRSLSLQNESLHSSFIQTNNSVSRSFSVSTADRYGDRSSVDFKNAERKGWLYVRMDDEVNWKKRWVVLIDNRLFILKSPDSDEDSSINMNAPKILLTLELDATHKVLPDNNNGREHNFLLQDPRLGGIHLAAENQLGVVTWINVLVRACTNTKRKPLPLIPLKNTGRQAREPLLSTQAVSTLTYEKVIKGSNYPTIYEDQSMEFGNPMAKRKNSINMSINGILSPNLESDYATSFTKNNEDSLLMERSPILKNRTNSIISNTFPMNPISPISPTQTAAAAANGWYRTTAKSATDYSNYRNLQYVSPEMRVQLQKTAKKLADPVVVTPILNPKKTMSFNPNKLEPNDNFNLNESSNMSFLNTDYSSTSKKSINSMGKNKHTSFSSYSNSGYNSSNQISPIEMMERRGIGSFITNNQTKVSKRNRFHHFIFK